MFDSNLLSRRTILMAASLATSRAVFAAGDEPSTSEQPPFEITLKMPDDKYVIGDEMLFQVVFTNRQLTPLGLWSRGCSWGHEGYVFEVTLADGARLTASEPERQWRRNSPSITDVEGDKTMTADFNFKTLELAAKDKAGIAKHEPLLAALKPGKVQLKVMYTSRRDQSLDSIERFKEMQNRLWVGELMSEPITLTIAAAGEARAAKKSPLSAKVLLAKEKVPAGGPAPFQVAFTNEGKETIQLWSRICSWGHEGYAFTITLPSGEKLSAEEAPRAWKANAPHMVQIKPGVTSTADFDLAQLAFYTQEKRLVLLKDQLKPGEVTIAASYTSKRDPSLDKNAEFKKMQDALWLGTVECDAAKVTVG